MRLAESNGQKKKEMSNICGSKPKDGRHFPVAGRPNQGFEATPQRETAPTQSKLKQSSSVMPMSLCVCGQEEMYLAIW